MPLANAFYERDFDWEELRAEREGEWDRTEIAPVVPSASEAQVWDSLYVHKGKLMFKPRRYILKAFPELERLLSEQQLVRILDCGSGNGASILPLVEFTSRVEVVAMDLSPSALELVHHPSISTLLFDLTSRVPPPLPPSQFDFALLVFTLSAIPVEFHLRAVENCIASLKPGGRLLFRDYGWMDLIQLRCKRRVGPATVCKADGVWCTFFTTDSLTQLFSRAGLEMGYAAKYCTVRNVNRKTNQTLQRVFIQAVGVKS